MKSYFNLISNIFVFIVGLLLVFLHAKAQIFELIIMILGILLIIPSCFSLINLLMVKEGKSSRYLMIVPIAGGLVLGITMVAVPEFYFGFLAYTFAAILIVGALFKFWTLLMLGKTIKLPITLYVVPVVMLVCGIILIATPVREIQSALVLITGLALVAYSINSLLEYILVRKAQKAVKEADRLIEEVNVEEVK